VTSGPGRFQQHGQKFNWLSWQLDLQAMFEQFTDLGVEFEGANADAAGGSLGVIHCGRLSCHTQIMHGLKVELASESVS
jgi:hypothetical protein